MPRVYALRAPKVRNECAHICAMGPKELSHHLHATVYKGASAYILASKTTIAVDSPWVSCDHTFRLLGHIGLTNTQGCSVFQILMGLS